MNDTRNERMRTTGEPFLSLGSSSVSLSVVPCLTLSLLAHILPIPFGPKGAGRSRRSERDGKEMRWRRA